MKKLVLITCYFGKFPWYFNLFIKSCTYNPTVDFIIFSDYQTNYKLPKNVKIVPFTLEQFNQLATLKLGFNISIKYAYKICDFKPAYGLIFSKYIKDYDFWGMTDIDIVFGRIREFITDNLLNDYEVISVRNDYPTGSFMLFQNNKTINILFTKSKDYKMIFQTDRHFCFDECNFKHDFLQQGGNIFDIDCEIESMHHVIKKEEANNNLKAHFDFLVIEGLPGKLKWEKGFLSFKNEFEVLLHHLILYKSNTYTRKKEWKEVPDTFFIDKYAIRKSELNSLKGFLFNLYYNKIRPNFYKKLYKIDYFISNTFSFNIKGLKYDLYNLNGMSLYISKNNSGENLLSFSEKVQGNIIVKSLFNNDAFYIKNYYFTRYILRHKENQIKTQSIDGTVQIFDKVS